MGKPRTLRDVQFTCIAVTGHPLPGREFQRVEGPTRREGMSHDMPNNEMRASAEPINGELASGRVEPLERLAPEVLRRAVLNCEQDLRELTDRLEAAREREGAFERLVGHSKAEAAKLRVRVAVLQRAAAVDLTDADPVPYADLLRRWYRALRDGGLVSGAYRTTSKGLALLEATGELLGIGEVRVPDPERPQRDDGRLITQEHLIALGALLTYVRADHPGPRPSLRVAEELLGWLRDVVSRREFGEFNEEPVRPSVGSAGNRAQLANSLGVSESELEAAIRQTAPEEEGVAADLLLRWLETSSCACSTLSKRTKEFLRPAPRG